MSLSCQCYHLRGEHGIVETLLSSTQQFCLNITTRQDTGLLNKYCYWHGGSLFVCNIASTMGACTGAERHPGTVAILFSCSFKSMQKLNRFFLVLGILLGSITNQSAHIKCVRRYEVWGSPLGRTVLATTAWRATSIGPRLPTAGPTSATRWRLVLQKCPSELHPKVHNHGEGPY